MTFRQSVLALAAPVLSIVLIGCQPPLEEKKAGGEAAPGTTEGKMTPAPTTNPAPADAKPKTEETVPTPSPEAPKEAPAEVKPDMPKEATPKA